MKKAAGIKSGKGKKTLLIIGIGAVLFVASEVYARLGLGLGDPPLSIADEKIEYLFAPNQDCHRFGNRIHYNDVSLRNDYDSSVMTNGCEVVLMLGDSVLNGGVLTDQDRLATTIAERDLRAEGRDIRILNCSAGSWGPVNCAEYVRKYGDYGAKSVWMLLNPGDLWDVPDYTPIVGSRAFPDKKPLLASWELVNRYLVPRIQGLFKPKVSRIVSGEGLIRGGMTKDAAEAASLAAIKYCLDRVPQKRGIIYSRLKTDWSSVTLGEGEAKLREFCKKNGYGFRLLELKPETDYRKNDGIHINDNGQQKLAELIKSIIW